jgi:zinc/manganese transport system ATP-binding protein
MDRDAAIGFDALSLGYGEREVLAGLSGSIRPGEFVAVLGPNGSGKSTLLRALLGLIAPRSGRVEVFGRPPARGNPHIGYLPQLRSLEAASPLSGRAHLRAALDGRRWGFSLPDRDKDGRVDAALRLVDAEAFMFRPYSTLSGGERQRIALAQALLGQPRLLLLDEPLLGLDPRRQGELIAAVDEVRRRLGITVLFVSHDVNPLLSAMDRVLYLAGGHAALGGVDEVVTSESLSRLYQVPIRVCQVGDLIFIVAEGARTIEHGDHLL